MPCNPLLQLEHVNKYYDCLHVIKDVSFTLEQGEIGCLLGPSGCGKTTLLRTIAGFERIASGRISIVGVEVAGSGFLPPERRGIGMVFQDYALFPHLTVAQNVAIGLRGLSRQEQRQRVKSLLETVGLGSEHGRYPHELSGGQQQRVALARALAPEPALLLMDEPFSNLDVALREKLSAEIRDILKERSMTALMVTHNQNEAFAMADKVGVLACGTMRQWGSPLAVYQHPADAVVASFIGEGTLLCGAMSADGTVSCALGTVAAGNCSVSSSGEQVVALIRPENITCSDTSGTHVRAVSRTFRGHNSLYTLQVESGEEIQALFSSTMNLQTGQRISICLNENNLSVFPVCND
ncbi:ABC transporter ATP-binding protein [Oleidesulfovibrio sp.]|uniref:ABC transporter ATP-binding protein n=1 Tax=Oleidesulfovibrio sp. TaxID=2909707 RepID=UPI003A877D7A